MCQLCFTEKAFIVRGDKKLLLNKRSEVFQRCRHRDGHMLANFYSRGRRNGNRGGALDGVAEEDSGGGGEASMSVVVEEEEENQQVEVVNDVLTQDGRQLRENTRVDYSAFY